MVTVVLRKGYGLGAMAMAGGEFTATLATLAWPTGEVGGMGLEGAVRLAMRKELAAIVDDDERQQAYEKLVAAAYEQGSALSAATYDEIDDVIDPADTRARVAALLGSWLPPRRDARRRVVDTW
jgi:acetyl-CoA carboxylase carboxyltransferase component